MHRPKSWWMNSFCVACRPVWQGVGGWIPFVLRAARCDRIPYTMDCFGAYYTHVHTCENVRAQSAKQRTESVHTLHMSKPVKIMSFPSFTFSNNLFCITYFLAYLFRVDVGISRMSLTKQSNLVYIVMWNVI